ncbi:MAG: hypothetical protein ACREOK_12720 [Gemmatimonadaceae bacterium]
MILPNTLRRAALLGLASMLSACDIVEFATNPAPKFEELWSLPADSTTISVGTLLPPSVSIFSTPASSPPDSIAFQLAMNLLPVSRRVGDDCSQCQTLNGQTTVKPAFVLTSGRTTALPTDVISGALVGGQVNVQVSNTLSFDPIRVKTGPGAQGFMLIVLRSGSLVVARDSVNGATTPFAPGTVLLRPLTLQSGVVAASITVDLTINSPAGDHNVPIDASGRVDADAIVQDFRLAQARINVTSRPLSSPGTDSLPLDGLHESISNSVTAAALDMTISNPFAIAGIVDVEFGYAPSQAILKAIDLPNGVDQVRSVTLDQTEVRTLFGQKVGLGVSGLVSSAGPIDVTPKQVITIANRLRLTILTGGAN